MSEAPTRQGLSFRAQLAVMSGLVAACALGWWLHFRPVAESDPTTIADIPAGMGSWVGVDVPISESVERMLRADSQVQRRYENRAGEIVWLYVGYYGTARGGRPEHTPWACYPSAGWQIVERTERLLEVEEAERGKGVLNELVVEQSGEQRLVHFWYATHRQTAIASETALTLDHVRGRFSRSGRADGALVRISTPIEARDREGARARLNRFASSLVPEIRRRWPDTLPESTTVDGGDRGPRVSAR